MCKRKKILIVYVDDVAKIFASSWIKGVRIDRAFRVRVFCSGRFSVYFSSVFSRACPNKLNVLVWVRMFFCIKYCILVFVNAYIFSHTRKCFLKSNFKCLFFQGKLMCCQCGLRKFSYNFFYVKYTRFVLLVFFL